MFIFWPILLKPHILASEIESFATTYCLSKCGQEKVRFTPFFGLAQGRLMRPPSCRNFQKP